VVPTSALCDHAGKPSGKRLLGDWLCQAHGGVIGLNQWRSYGNAYNATATPYFDREAGCPKLKIIDFSLLGQMGQADLAMTKAELFEAIWTRMVQQMESIH
jgi:hypothetical protein